MSSQSRYRFKLGDFIVELRVDHNIQITISRDGRRELRHLTINWGNPDKTVRLHLTLNKPNGEKEYTNKVSVPEANFERLFNSFGLELSNFVFQY